MHGVDHVSLSVTDLDRSERFYRETLGLVRLADFGHVRILFHRPTSLLVALTRHDAADGTPFSELRTGLDHFGFAVATRDELVTWQQHLVALGVELHTDPRHGVRAHLNFRDPDNIALELSTSNEIAAQWYAELRERDIPQEEIDARLSAYLASLGGLARG